MIDDWIYSLLGEEPKDYIKDIIIYLLHSRDECFVSLHWIDILQDFITMKQLVS